MPAPPSPAIIVGLSAEARIARRLGWPVAVGGGTQAGAAAAAQRMIDRGATALISFGLAGGLDPALQPGTIIVPTAVLTTSDTILTAARITSVLGGVTPHTLLAAEMVADTATMKRQLWQSSGAAAVDLESGAVAQTARAAGVPFGVLRAICDPASRNLPPAALIALKSTGAIGLGRVAASVLAHPGQTPALLRLAADAFAARRALTARVARL